MTASSFGPKKQPRFAAGDAPDLSGNPTEVADYAAKFGNYTEGTTAERNTATSWAWEGLMFWDTTLKCAFAMKNGGWVPASAPTAQASNPSSGTAYNGQSPLVIKAVNVIATTDGAGRARFPWPGGAFPNALLAYSPTVGDGAAFAGWVSNFGSNAAQADVIARLPNGPLVGTNVRIQGVAVGW